MILVLGREKSRRLLVGHYEVGPIATRFGSSHCFRQPGNIENNGLGWCAIWGKAKGYLFVANEHVHYPRSCASINQKSECGIIAGCGRAPFFGWILVNSIFEIQTIPAGWSWRKAPVGDKHCGRTFLASDDKQWNLSVSARYCLFSVGSDNRIQFIRENRFSCVDLPIGRLRRVLGFLVLICSIVASQSFCRLLQCCAFFSQLRQCCLRKQHKQEREVQASHFLSPFCVKHWLPIEQVGRALANPDTAPKMLGLAR